MALDPSATDSNSNGSTAPATADPAARPVDQPGKARSASRPSGGSVDERLARLERQAAQLGRERQQAIERANAAEARLQARERSDQERLNKWLSEADEVEIGRYFKQQATQRKPDPDPEVTERLKREAREEAAREMTATLLAQAREKGYFTAEEYQDFVDRASRGEASVEDFISHGARFRDPVRQRVAATRQAAEQDEAPVSPEGEAGAPEPAITPATLQELKGTGPKGIAKIRGWLGDPKKRGQVMKAWESLGKGA